LLDRIAADEQAQAEMRELRLDPQDVRQIELYQVIRTISDMSDRNQKRPRGRATSAEQWLEDEKVLPGGPTDAPSGPVQKTPRKRRVENPDEGEARPIDTTSDISGGQRPRSKRKYF
jgi:hypothetical protein